MPVLGCAGRCRSGLEMMALRAGLCLAIVVAHVVEPPTRVELMAAGANRVCLRAGQPEAETWLEGPRYFDNVKEELLLHGACGGDEINFCAVIPAESMG